METLFQCVFVEDGVRSGDWGHDWPRASKGLGLMTEINDPWQLLLYDVIESLLPQNVKHYLNLISIFNLDYIV